LIHEHIEIVIPCSNVFFVNLAHKNINKNNNKRVFVILIYLKITVTVSHTLIDQISSLSI